MAAKNGAIKLVAGNSNPALAEAIAAYLKTPLAQGRGAALRRHGDLRRDPGERPRRGRLRLQSTSFPANDHLMELLIIIDALRRSSARRITAVIPYFGYARQDRKPGPRTPISAKLVANLITRAGADRVLTLDLHAGQIQGFFDIPTDNLFASPVMVRDIKERFDARQPHGGVARRRRRGARARARQAHRRAARHRRQAARAGRRVRGDERHRRRRRATTCILVDDIVDSGGTLVNAAEALLEQGAERGRRLHHPRRAVGRRGRAHHRLQAQGAGDHRLDPADRGGAAPRATSACCRSPP